MFSKARIAALKLSTMIPGNVADNLKEILKSANLVNGTPLELSAANCLVLRSEGKVDGIVPLDGKSVDEIQMIIDFNKKRGRTMAFEIVK